MAAVVDQTPTKAETTSNMFSVTQDQSSYPAVDYSSIRMKVMKITLKKIMFSSIFLKYLVNVL